MAKQARTDAVWVEIDASTLKGECASAYAEYKAAYKVAKEWKQRFEIRMEQEANLPEDKRLVFGYNFGKLSVAVVENDHKAKVTKAGAQSLSQYLAGMTQKGR
jgi:hypothetical protein